MDCGNLYGMNLTKVNNRENNFYKYKAAECVSVPTVVCEELIAQESLVQLFKLMDEFYLKVFNINLKYVPMSYGDLTEHGTSIRQIQNISGIIFPVELSDIAKDDFWYHSPLFITSELILMTGPPTEVQKYSMSFLTLDSTVLCLLLLCIVALPLLAGLSEFVTSNGQGKRRRKTPIRRRKTPLRRRLGNYLNLSWNFVVIFFYEPFYRVLKCLSWRITIGSWLVAILIISIFMGSALKTELYSTEHILIDSLESFSKYTQAKIRFSRTDNAAGFFEEWEKSMVESQPELSLASRVEYSELADALDGDKYKEIFFGKTGVLIPKFYLDVLMPILLEADADLRKLSFYFNAKRIKNLLFVFPVSKELKGCPEFIEQMNLGMYVSTETKYLEYLYFKNNFYMSRIVWKKPTKSLSAMTISETYGVFLIFAYGLGISTAVFISEVIIKFFSTYR